MLHLTKKEIDNKFFQVISSYEKVLSSLKENKYSDISYNLDNIRFLNSEIQCMVKEFAILDKNKFLKMKPDILLELLIILIKMLKKKLIILMYKFLKT